LWQKLLSPSHKSTKNQNNYKLSVEAIQNIKIWVYKTKFRN